MGDQTAKPPVTGYPAGHPAGGYYSTRPQGSGAAYNGGYPQQPYPAYPQPYPAYPANQAPRPYRARRFLSIIVALVVIVGIAVLITWLVLRPQRPKFHVENVTVSQLNVKNNELNATMHFNISARNPNKKIGIYYDFVGVGALYRDRKIVSNRLPGFYQGHKNTTVISCPLSAESLYLDTDVSSNLLGERATGSVDMTVNLNAFVRFKVGSWRTREHSMSVYCHVSVDWNNSTTGRLSQNRGCSVYI